MHQASSERVPYLLWLYTYIDQASSEVVLVGLRSAVEQAKL